MRIPFYIWIAWRYLLARARQTALTVSGVVLGVTIVALMQSYIGGFLNYFIERALESTPSVTVTQAATGLPNPAGPLQRALGPLANPAIAVSQLPIPNENEELKNPRVAEEEIRRIPDVVTLAPFVNGQGIIINGDQRQPVTFTGIRPLEEARVTDLAKRLLEGTPNDLAQNAGGIILGSILADNLSAGVGDRVTVISQDGISRRFQVVGIYSSGLREVDLVRAYINLRQGQQLMMMRGFSGLGVRTTSLDTAEPVAQRIEQATPYTAKSWRELNANTLNLFTTISFIIYLVVGFTMIVAGFGIANALILTVNEKRRDIGVLKALGTPPRQIANLFLTTGILIGLAGVLLGELLGAAGIALLAHTPIPIKEQAGVVSALQTFPVLRTARVYLVAGVFGLLVSIASSVLPSLRAAKADPVEVIRGAE